MSSEMASRPSPVTALHVTTFGVHGSPVARYPFGNRLGNWHLDQPAVEQVGGAEPEVTIVINTQLEVFLIGAQDHVAAFHRTPYEMVMDTFLLQQGS